MTANVLPADAVALVDEGLCVASVQGLHHHGAQVVGTRKADNVAAAVVEIQLVADF